MQAYFGDATRPDLLHAAGIDDASMLVIAIDDQDRITELAHYVHTTHPHIHIIGRAINRDHVYQLWHAGCRDIIRETYDSSLRMGRSAFVALGHSVEDAQRMADEFEKTDRASMVELASLYDPDIPTHENEAYTARVREISSEWEKDLRGRMLQNDGTPEADQA